MTVIALAAVVALITRVSYPPFQDFPNQLHILTLDRAIDTPEVERYFQRPPYFVFGYSLTSLLGRAGDGWIPEATALRLLFLVAALGFPFGVAWLARVVGADWRWAALLALPLALSWPLKMGFIQFSLGLAITLFAIAAAVRTVREPGPRQAMALALWTCLAYMSHALTLGLVTLGIGLAWLDARGSRARALIALTLAVLPAAALVAIDLSHDVFRAIPATAVSLEHHPTSFRSLGYAFAHLFTRSYGITDGGALLWFGPFLLVLVAAGLTALWRHRGLRSTDSSYLLWAVPAAILVCLFVPEATERIYFMGSRLAAMAMGLVTILAAVTLARASRPIQRIAVAAVLLAFAGSLGDTLLRSTKLVEILGTSGPERVSGRYLTAQIGPCPPPGYKYWGRYESARHLWAYALAPGGVTPYLFAWSRYHSVQYRGDVYRELLRAPLESINGDGLLRGSCADANRERLAGATSWGGFDGALITGRPTDLANFAGHPGLAGSRALAPGLWLARSPTPRPEALHVDMNHYGSAQYLGQGWGEAEYAGDRTVRWNDGAFSEVTFELAPRSTPYALQMTTYPYAAAMPQSVGIALNGEPLATLVPTDGWQEPVLFVAGDRLRRGVNRLTLTYERVLRPSEVDGSADERQLALMFDSIDLGPLADSASLEMDADDHGWSFARGWSGLEQREDRSVRWSEGESSTLEFHLAPLSVPYRLTFEAMPYEPTLPQSVTVTLNGKVLETLFLAEGWREYTVHVPADRLRVENNEIQLDYAAAVRPSDISESSDRRRLGVLFDSLALAPKDSL